jgi:heme exporter protein C
MYLKILDVISLSVLFIATGLVFFYAPMEAVMGKVQKVFYFHVASAWVGMLGFLVAALSGIIYLSRGERKWDFSGMASVEIGLVFSFIAVVSGSIWARPIWNTWWTWDPRLTTTTIMMFVYAAYLMLRSGLENPDRRARFGAVYAIIGFISVPLTFFSARLYRTIHPVIIGSIQTSTAGNFDMTTNMLQVFLFSLFTFSIIFFDLLIHRVRLAKLQEQVEQFKIYINN